MRKPKSKPALCATSGKSSMKSSSSSAVSRERGLSDRKMVGQAVDRLGLERHVALGIEISVEVAAGLDPVEHLDAADLDHAVAAGRIEARGFGVEDDFPHARIYRPAASPRQARMSRTWASVVDRSPPVSMTKSARRALLRVGHLAREDRVELGRASCRAARAPAPRCTSAGAETTITLSNASSPPVSNSKRNVEQQRRRVAIGERGTRRALRCTAGWTIASSAASFVADRPSTICGKAVAVERRRRGPCPGKRSPISLDQRAARPCSCAHHGVGIEHRNAGRLEHLARRSTCPCRSSR